MRPLFSKLRQAIDRLFQHDLLIILLGTVVLEIVFLVLALSLVEIPGNAVLHSGLRQVFYVFEQ